MYIDISDSLRLPIGVYNTLPNPNTLVISQANDADKITYDGSAAKELNITPDSVGALATSGGTMTGPVTTKGIRLTKDVDYGDTLPETLMEGQLSFQMASNLVLDLVYPIGSIYMSVNETSPSTLFGGTWEAIRGRFLIGTGRNEANTQSQFGENDFPEGAINIPAGAMGGEAKHQLKISEIPDHGHDAAVNGGTSDYGQTRTTIGNFAQKTSGYIDNSTILHTGGSGSHNNMPPYLSVYMWKRTA